MTEGAPVAVENLAVSYGGEVAVDGLSFEVNEGELFCLLGPSGCGKTTTLKAIAGLEGVDSGSVRVGGEDVTDEPANSRDTSVVFQEWALFPRKTVAGNIGFGPRMDGEPRSERRRRVEELLEKVGLSGQEDAYPDELSGGQKQRVALARSLAADPSVLLLDEPLSNLDESLRREMRLELLRLHDEFGKTTVHVTHDQEEAFTLADRVGVMRDGRLVQVGEPSEVYADPGSRFVEEFLGETTFVEGTAEGGSVETRLGAFGTDGFSGAAEVSVRPESVRLSRVGASADGGRAPDGEGAVGTVLNRADHGSTVRYHLDVEGIGDRVLAEYGARDDPGFGSGDEVAVEVVREPPVFADDGSRVG